MAISQKARNAMLLGSLCSVSYLAVYIARNILGAVTPKMTSAGFSLEYIGQVSAVYLIAYACGQLINGYVGDRIKPKYMIPMGLLLAGIANFVFVGLASQPGIALVAYGWTGFSLSMIYGPMTKVVAESIEPIYATRCSIGYTFASFFGSPTAGILATFLTWQATFGVSSIVLIIMSVVCFTFFSVFEKKGIVKYVAQAKGPGAAKKNYKQLLERHIVKFALVAIITGIIRTSLVSFLSTYYFEYLSYSESEAASIFSVSTLVICFTTFIAIFIYERLKRNMHLCILIFFSVSALFFGILYFVTEPVLNIAIIILAIMASNASATILWSVYCVSMRDTGMVSRITGFLDFLSYVAAALGSLLIPKISAAVGWRNTLLFAVALMAFGVAISVPYFIKKKRSAQ